MRTKQDDKGRENDKVSIRGQEGVEEEGQQGEVRVKICLHEIYNRTNGLCFVSVTSATKELSR